MTPPKNILDDLSSLKPKPKKEPKSKRKFKPIKIAPRVWFYLGVILITLILTIQEGGAIARSILLKKDLGSPLLFLAGVYKLAAIGFLFFETEKYNIPSKTLGSFFSTVGVIGMGTFTLLWFFFVFLENASLWMQGSPPVVVVLLLWTFPVLLAIEFYCRFLAALMGEPTKKR